MTALDSSAAILKRFQRKEKAAEAAKKKREEAIEAAKKELTELRKDANKRATSERNRVNAARRKWETHCKCILAGIMESQLAEGGLSLELLLRWTELSCSPRHAEAVLPYLRQLITKDEMMNKEEKDALLVKIRLLGEVKEAQKIDQEAKERRQQSSTGAPAPAPAAPGRPPPPRPQPLYRQPGTGQQAKEADQEPEEAEQEPELAL